MDDQARRGLVMDAIRRKTMANLKDKKSARAGLLKDGFITRSGELAPEYGGPERKKVSANR
jgi:hypothetical protein